MEPSELATSEFIPSRIPAQDGLVGFVPSRHEGEPWIEAATALTRKSRWYPAEGGHRIVILYEGGAFDAAHLSLERGVWEHEHCSPQDRDHDAVLGDEVRHLRHTVSIVPRGG